MDGWMNKCVRKKEILKYYYCYMRGAEFSQRKGGYLRLD